MEDEYRKTPKISPSKYKPPPGGPVFGNCPQIQSKTKRNGKFPSKNKASPIDFKTQISLRKEAPQKGALKNISPGAYFRNFTVSPFSFTLCLPGKKRFSIQILEKKNFEYSGTSIKL